MPKESNYEVYFQEGNSIWCVSEEGNLVHSGVKSLSGMALRLLHSPYKIMLSTTHSRSDFEQIAHYLEEYDHDVLLLNEKEKMQSCEEGVCKSEELRDFSEAVSSKFKGIRCMIRRVETNKMIYCQDNAKTKLCSNSTYIQLYISSMCQVHPEIKRDYYLPIKNLSDITYKRTIELIQEEVPSMLRPLYEKNENDEFSLVFEKKAASVLFHEICGHYLEAGKLRNGIGGEIGKQITTYPLNVYNQNFSDADPVICDDEGMEKTEQQIICDGKVKAGLLDSRYQAEGMILCGNSRRESIFNYPEPRMFKIKVSSGNSTFDELVTSVSKGFVISRVLEGNYNSRTQIVDLLVQIRAEIIDGEMKGKYSYAYISESIFDIYKNIRGLSDNCRNYALNCTSNSGELYTESEAPDVLVDKIRIKERWIVK